METKKSSHNLCEIWHSIVRVHSIVRDLSPPSERHVIPYYAITRGGGGVNVVLILNLDDVNFLQLLDGDFCCDADEVCC